MIGFRKSLLLVLIFVFNACGGGDGDNNGQNSSPQNNLNNNSTQNEVVSQKKALGALIPTEEMLSEVPVALPPVSSYASNELPSSFDLSSKMPPVRNQGGQGSCASWAVGYYLKAYHEHVDNNTDYGTGSDHSGVYSPAFLYNSVKIGSCDEGSYIYKNLDRVKDVGIASWKDMPYNEKKCDTKPSSTATTHAKCAKILDYQRIRLHEPIEKIEMQDIKYYLSHGNPIIIGILVYDGFNNPKRVNGDFFYKEYNEDGYRGGHAIVVVGYDDNKNAFKIINSWGRNWGNDGFLWIDYDVFSRIVFEAYRTTDVLNECEEDSSYISIDKQKLLFNTKPINASYKESFTISNSGSESFTITNITVPNGYTVDWTRGRLEASAEQKITVTFSPTEDKSYNGKLIIEHNADQGNSNIELVGEGIDKNNPNLLPIAKAGEDITVKVGESVKLDASKSSDDGEIVSYEWKSGATLLSNNKIFIKSDFSVGTHRITLKVTDDKGLTSTDNITVVVTNKSNLSPIANAGENISVSFGESVSFDASKSKDNDGKIVKYQWKEGNKILSNSSKFSKKDFSEGKHTITLIVTDNKGATDKDMMIVTVSEKGNSKPVANAGEDITITFGGDIFFNASKSTDDKKIIEYAWSSSYYNFSLRHPSTTYSGLRLPIGKHTFTLTVKDSDGQTDTDTMIITVEASEENLKPVIRFSARNETLNFNLYFKPTIRANDTVKFYCGSSYDNDGEIISYEWKEGNNILSREIEFSKNDFSIGEHTLTLTLTDNEGAISTKEIILVVGRVNNTPPIAEAGNNKTIVLGEELMVDGSKSSDSDGDILYYSWSYKNSFTHSSTNSNYSIFPEIDKVGDYIFTLTVIDNDGAIATDTMTVTVVD